MRPAVGLLLFYKEKSEEKNMKKYKIAVAGTGYVGLSIATLLSQHNNRKSPILDDYIEKI